MLLVCNNLAPLLHPDLLIGGTAPSNLSPFVSLYFVISRYSLMVVKLLYSRVFFAFHTCGRVIQASATFADRSYLSGWVAHRNHILGNPTFYEFLKVCPQVLHWPCSSNFSPQTHIQPISLAGLPTMGDLPLGSDQAK